MFASKRLVLLLAAVGAVAVVAAAPSGASGESDPPSQLRPDLRPRRPADLYVDRQDGRRFIRLANEIVNVGTGPLEVTPDPSDCDGDGVTEGEATAWQSTYLDRDGSGAFSRAGDHEDPDRSRVGCLRYHAAPEHNHWHLDDFALYELIPYGANGVLGAPVRSSDKVSFCLLDTHRRRDLAGSPRLAYYLASYCKNNGSTGISIGWSDVYTANLPGQEIDITGVPNGKYCLRTTIDPDHKIVELREDNNLRGRRIWLTRSGFTYAHVKGCLPKN